MKAIETVYNGYRFRSRLEARWAVFFDALEIEYQYEPEGFETDGGFYLPDFYLPVEKCYVEVKGTDEALFEDGKKIAFAIDYNATPCSEGLLILGDIPNPTWITWGNVPLFSYLHNYKGIVLEYATFVPFGYRKLVRGNANIIKSIYSFKDFLNGFSVAYGDYNIPVDTTTKCKWFSEELRSYAFDEENSKSHILVKAYTKARQARFEHGEAPTFL